MNIFHNERDAPHIIVNILASFGMAALFIALCTAPAMASSYYFDPSANNYSGPGPTVITVTKVKEMAEDEYVTIRGSIIQSLGEADYLFKDATGTVVVRIDSRAWNDQRVKHTDAVEVQGKVRKKRSEVQVEAQRILPLKGKK